MTVYIHLGSSGRNCRETIASLRNARATRYHITNFLHVSGRQWLLRRQRYHVLTRICECRETERAGENPDCKSDRPAAPATQSGSSSHGCDSEPAANLSKPIRRPTSHLWTSPLPSACDDCFSPSKENVRAECCSDALLLLRYGCRLLPRACHRSRRRIPT